MSEEKQFDDSFFSPSKKAFGRDELVERHYDAANEENDYFSNVPSGFRQLPRPPYRLETQNFKSLSDPRELVEIIVDLLNKHKVFYGPFDARKCKIKAHVINNHERISMRIFFYSNEGKNIVEFQRRDGDPFAFNELYFDIFKELKNLMIVESFDHIEEMPKPLVANQQPTMASDEGIDHLLQMVNSEFVDIKGNGIMILARLADVIGNHRYLATENVVKAVINAFECGDRDVVRCSASILKKFAASEDGFNAIRDFEAYKPLVESTRTDLAPDALVECLNAVYKINARDKTLIPNAQDIARSCASDAMDQQVREVIERIT